MIEFYNLPDILENREDELRRWLRQIASDHNRVIVGVLYQFVDDANIVGVNKRHLAHDYPTDIVTFGYSEGKRIKTEIYIGIETVERNASELGVKLIDEVCRVIAHGLLHVVGYDDGTEQEKKEMRAAEEKYLLLRPKNLRSN